MKVSLFARALRFSITLFATALLCNGFAFTAYGDDVVKLRFAALSPAGGYIYSQHLQPFADAVEKASNGRLIIDLQPVGTYGRPAQAFELVEAGVIDMAWTIQGYTPGRFRQSEVLELPFMFDDAETGSAVFWRMYQEGLFGRDYGSVIPLALYLHRPYGIFTTEQPLRTLEDFTGLKIRAPGALTGRAFEMLGATPIGLQATEMAEGVRLGTINAVAFPWEAIKLYGMDGLFNTLTDAKISSPRFIVLMNKRRFEKLPKDLQNVIRQHSGYELSRAIGAGVDKMELQTKQAYLNDPKTLVLELGGDERRRIEARIAPLITEWLQGDKRNTSAERKRLLKRAQKALK